MVALDYRLPALASGVDLVVGASDLAPALPVDPATKRPYDASRRDRRR